MRGLVTITLSVGRLEMRAGYPSRKFAKAMISCFKKEVPE